MSKNSNLIEKKLLSRCRTFEKESKVLEILEKRYSATGDQKNFLILKPTSAKNERKEKLKNLMHELLNKNGKSNKYDKTKTRNEFKLFIKSNLSLQRRIEHKLKTTHNQLEQLKEFKQLLKFEDFIQLNQLWNEYIKNLIQNSKPIDKIQQSDMSNILSKLSSADMIGSYITVKASTNNMIIDVSGIVIWESQNNFIIVVPRSDSWKTDLQVPVIDGQIPNLKWTIKEQIGGIKIVPKKKTIFKLLVPESSISSDGVDQVEFDIIGSRFNIKSFERANKKFKNHNVDDII